MARVLHVIATLDPAGAERQMALLCARLDRRRYAPSVCCLTRGGPLEADLAAAGVPVQVLHKRGRWELRALGRLTRLIRQTRPDIVHTWLPTANTLGRIAAMRAGAPVRIASERAADVWKGFARRAVDRFLTKRTAAIITNAEAVQRFLIERIGLPGAKIVVVRNGVDLARFDEAAHAGPQAPLPPRGPGLLVGTAGRLEPQKGMRFLLEALAMLPDDLAAARLWIAGEGPEEAALRGQAAALGIAPRVEFLGLRADVPALMGLFDLFVLPSLWEGLPNAVLEAMAARRAVAATAVDGTPEAVTEGVTGLLAPPSNAAALAGIMTRLLRDEAMRRRFGEAGRARVAEAFGIERMVRETEAVYERALRETPQ